MNVCTHLHANSAISSSHTYPRTRSHCLMLLSYSLTKTHLFHTITKERGLETQTVGALLLGDTFRKLLSPLLDVFWEQKQIATEFQGIIVICWIQSTWIWKIWISAFGCGFGCYMITCKSLLWIYISLPTGLDAVVYQALLHPALVSCYTHVIFTQRKFQKSYVVLLSPV